MEAVLQHLGYSPGSKDPDAPPTCKQCGGDIVSVSERVKDDKGKLLPEPVSVRRCGLCGMPADANVQRPPLTMSVGASNGDLQKRVNELERENAALKAAQAPKKNEAPIKPARKGNNEQNADRPRV